MPAWMLADGEYVGLGVGERVTTGLALAVTGATVGVPAVVGLEQTGEPPAFTTLTGRVECPRDADGTRAGTVLCAGPWAVVPFAATPLGAGEDVVVSGWLTLEPYLWATGSALARAVPVGRQDLAGRRGPSRRRRRRSADHRAPPRRGRGRPGRRLPAGPLGRGLTGREGGSGPLADPLVLVHRGVGLGDRGREAPVHPERGDPEGAGHVGVEQDRLQTVGEPFGIVDPDGGHHPELVPAQAGERIIAPHGPGQGLRGAADEAVPGVVALGVVDRLQPVEVHHHHARRVAEAPEPLLLAGQPALPAAPVEQACEGVGLRLGGGPLELTGRADRRAVGVEDARQQAGEEVEDASCSRNVAGSGSGWSPTTVPNSSPPGRTIGVPT